MAEKKEKVAAEAVAEEKKPAKKAPAKTAAKKTAADSAPAKKTAAKKAVSANDVAATEAAPAVKAPAKKAVKKPAAKAPLYINGRYVVEKQLPAKPQKGTAPYAKAAGKVKVTLAKSTVGCLDDQIATVKALGLTKIRTSNVLPDNAATRGMIFKVKHLVVVEDVK